MPRALVYDMTQLVVLLKNKDRNGFEVLYDRYHAALFGLLCRIVKEDETAENLLQDVFVKIWKNIQEYDSGKGTLFTWMLNITRNTAIDYLRSKRFQQQRQNQPIENSVGIENKLAATIDTDAIYLQEHVAKLPDIYKQAIDYLYFMGYTHEEAAETLKIPLGTLKTRARKALQELRKIFDVG